MKKEEFLQENQNKGLRAYKQVAIMLMASHFYTRTIKLMFESTSHFYFITKRYDGEIATEIKVVV